MPPKAKKIVDVDEDINIIINNEEDLKKHFHGIHNFIRNKFGFYGKQALQFFNFLFVLKLIEPIIEELNNKELNKCKYSRLKDANDDSTRKDVLNDIRTIIFKDGSILKDTIFMNGSFDFPENKDYVQKLMKKIDILLDKDDKNTSIFDKYHVQGRVYEYFLGFMTSKNSGKKTGSQIEDLGQYYTSKNVIRYCMAKVNPKLDKSNNVPTMGDFFCGSAGFITEYIRFLNHRNPEEIDWTNNITDLFGCETGRDIMNSALVDILLLTECFTEMLEKTMNGSKDFSMKGNIKRIGSTFDEEFNDDKSQKVKYNFTNPPYGGDKGKEKDDKVNLEQASKSIKHIATTGSINLDKPPKGFKPTKTKKYLINGDNKETLALLHGMSVLEKDGIYCGVLKEGVFFDGKFKDLRKNLIENYDVKYVISVPQSDFWNTSTKTSILIFKNSGKTTSQINFCELKETNKDNVIQEINPETNKIISEFKTDEYKFTQKGEGYLNVNIDELRVNEYSLNYKNYIKQDIKVNEGFKVVKLGDICEFINYKSIDETENGIYNYYTCSNNVKKCNNANINDKCIIIGSRGTISNAIHLENGNFGCGNNMILFKNNDHLITTYLYYYLKNNKEKIDSKVTGSTVPMISKKELSEILIPIPSDISTIKLYLDYLNPANESLQSLQSLQSQKERSICGLIKMLTSFGKNRVEWDEYELKDVCLLNPNNKIIDFVKKNKYIEYLDIGNCLNFTTQKLLNDNNLPSRAKKHVLINDIILSSVRPANKNINIITTNNFKENLIVSTGFIILRPQKINPNYLYFYILRNDITDYFISKSTGSGYPAINSSDIENMKIRILKPEILKKYKLEEEFEFMDKLKNDIPQTLKNQEDITKQMMKLVLSSEKEETEENEEEDQEIEETEEEIEEIEETEEDSEELDELDKLEKELEEEKPKRKIC